MTEVIDINEIVEKQLPEVIRNRVNVILKTDPYHLRTIAVFVDKLNPHWRYECQLQTIKLSNNRRLAVKIPAESLAFLCVSF